MERAMGGFCAMAASTAIDGIGPFKDLGMRLIPDTLYWALREIQNQQNKETNNSGK